MPAGTGSPGRTRPDVSGRAIKSPAGRDCDVNNEGHSGSMPVRARLSIWWPNGTYSRFRSVHRPSTYPPAQSWRRSASVSPALVGEHRAGVSRLVLHRRLFVRFGCRHIEPVLSGLSLALANTVIPSFKKGGRAVADRHETRMMRHRSVHRSGQARGQARRRPSSRPVRDS